MLSPNTPLSEPGASLSPNGSSIGTVKVYEVGFCPFASQCYSNFMTRHAVETKTAEGAHRSGCPSGFDLGIAPAHHRQIVRIGGISFANTTCQINNLDKAAFPCTRIMTT